MHTSTDDWSGPRTRARTIAHRITSHASSLNRCKLLKAAAVIVVPSVKLHTCIPARCCLVKCSIYTLSVRCIYVILIYFIQFENHCQTNANLCDTISYTTQHHSEYVLYFGDGAHSIIYNRMFEQRKKGENIEPSMDEIRDWKGL